MEPSQMSGLLGTIALISNVVALAMVGVFIASCWKLFTKAGIPGWHCLIPVLNVVQYCRLAGRSGWWALGLIVPLLNFVFGVILSIDLAKRFGKGAGFAAGLILLPVVFMPMLAFGNSRYLGRHPSGPSPQGGNSINRTAGPANMVRHPNQGVPTQGVQGQGIHGQGSHSGGSQPQGAPRVQNQIHGGPGNNQKVA